MLIRSKPRSLIFPSRIEFGTGWGKTIRRGVIIIVTFDIRATVVLLGFTINNCGVGLDGVVGLVGILLIRLKPQSLIFPHISTTLNDRGKTIRHRVIIIITFERRTAVIIMGLLLKGVGLDYLELCGC